MADFSDIQPFLDAEGRLSSWPSSKRGKGLQEMALEYLADKFEPERRYTEREVNELLNAHHTFGDPALLRRELIERGYLQRKKDGTQYWREKTDTGMGRRRFG
jgi:hypothetical protein